ncbi:MAG: alcohol dehydrogenase catalytic domain-containing protein [Planctomycetota bacterium]|nr:alcohol dehydrogenase catalytic domain-containing protein [Planctomycetota bacterium]
MDDPELSSPDQAIVKVLLAGLCGSDLHPFLGRETGLDPGTVMGHEFVGLVIETGSEVTSVSVGDRVCCPFTTNCGVCFYCDLGLTSRCEKSQLFGWRHHGEGLHGGQAEFVLVPDANGTLKKLNADTSDHLGLLLGDNLSTGVYCAEMAEVHPDGVYLVIGCGTVGLLTILAAIERGARKVFALDPVADRRKQAEQFGAIPVATEQAATNEINVATNSRGVDGVMELVGLLPAQSFAFRSIRPGGILSTVGCHCTPHFGFSPVDAYDKNIVYRTGRCPARHYMEKLSASPVSYAAAAEKLLTHEFGLSESVKAYDVFSNRKDGCMKAAFRFES